MVIERIRSMIKKIDYPLQLRALGIRESDIPTIVDDCMTQDDIAVNPRKFDKQAAKEFLESIL